MSLDVRLVDRCPHCDRAKTLYSDNITHNLTEMAEEAGIYNAMWRPEGIGITKARDLIPLLEWGIQALEYDPERFKKWSPSNGWGNHSTLLKFAKDYLAACRKHPDADVEASG